MEQNSDSNTEILLQYVRAAARVKLDSLPLVDDMETTGRGNTILYAIDTNILDLWVSPEKTGISKQRGGNGYANVFPDDKPSTSIALAIAISNYIFWRLGAPRPLALLFGHDAEARSFYERCLRDVGDAQNAIKEEKKNIRGILEKLFSVKSLNERLSIFEESAPNIMHMLYLSSSGGSEFYRLSRLLSQMRIVRVPSLLKVPGFIKGLSNIEARLQNAFKQPKTVSDMIVESIYRIEWMKRLGSGQKTPNALRVDSAALAQLQLINRSLNEYGDKLVLITGDEEILNAASKIVSENDNTKSFRREYLRHPRSFISVSDVLTPKVDSPSKNDNGLVLGWLETFLARFAVDSEEEILMRIIDADDEDEITQSLVSKVKDVLHVDPDCVNQIRQDWENYTNALVEAHSATSSLARDQIKHLFSKSDGARFEDMLRGIDVHLESNRQKEWNEFEQAMFKTGLELVAWDKSANKTRRRNLPLIHFDRFSQARNFVRWVNDGGGLSERTPGSIKEKIESIDRDDDPTGYAKTLALALLYGYADRWRAVSVVAERATEIAEAIRENVSRNGSQDKLERDKAISGREAYFLRAVALRFQARSQAQLIEAKSLLDTAREALIYDLSVEPNLSNSSIRFDTEEYALYLTMHLFKWFNQDKDLIVGIDLKGIILRNKELLNHSSFGEDSWFDCYILRRILTNIFMAAALMDLRDEPIDVVLYELLQGLVISYQENIMFNENQDEVKSPTISVLVQQVFDYALLRFGDPSHSEKSSIKGRLELESAGQNVASYDKERDAALRCLIQKALDNGVFRP